MAKWWRRDRDAEIREELDTHVALETERQIDNGLAPGEARDAAMRKFGNPIRHREDTRAAHGLVWWDHLSHDIRHALRAIARRPIAASAAMLALGVGIGGPAGVMSLLLSTSMLVPPGVTDPDALVMLWETPPQMPGSRRDATLETYDVWRRHASMFQAISGAGMPLRLLLDDADTPVRVRVQTMGVGLLPVLGLAPERGRAFSSRDAQPGADAVAIASQTFWETHLGKRDDVVGSSISLHGRNTTIVGVMPRTFWFASRGVDLWVPMPERNLDASPAPVMVIARMTPGDRKQAVQQRLTALAAQVAAEQPEREVGWGTRVDGVGASEMINSEDMPPGFKILLIATVLGGLAACANIATVMVARGAARHLETAVRAALGAPRLRLIRQFLVESVVVALGGGAVGVLVVVGMLRLVVASAPGDLAMAIAAPGPALIGGIVIVSIVIGVAAGLGPAIADSRVNLISALKTGGYFGSVRGNSRLRRALVIAEVTITVVLLAGISILARGALELSSIGPGFDAGRVIQMRIDPVEHIGRATVPPLDVDAVIEQFTTISGVESASFASGLLTGERRARVTISATDDAAGREVRRVHLNRVGHEYFRTLGLRIVDGRAFTIDDRHGAPVVMVSEAFARQALPAGTAIGRTLRIGDETEERTIVGVVSSVLLEGFRRQPSPIVYLPQATGVQADGGSGFIVRFAPGMRVLREMERAIERLNPLQTIGFSAIVKDALDAGAAEVRFTIYLVGPVLLLALALTMSGIYGVLAQSVTHRTHEVALRVALGAERADVLRLVAFQGLKLTMIGAIAGAAAALAADRLMGSFVMGVPGDRPMALLTATLLIALATMAASIAPCLRAMRIDPATTLRYE